jgi:hypothetical protein
MAHKDPEANRECVVPVDMIAVDEERNTLGAWSSSNRFTRPFSKWYKLLLQAGVEENGIRPVPPEERTETQYSNLFTVFFTCLLCILPLVVIELPSLCLETDTKKYSYWGTRHSSVRSGSARCFVDHHLLQHSDLPTAGVHEYRRI